MRGLKNTFMSVREICDHTIAVVHPVGDSAMLASAVIAPHNANVQRRIDETAQILNDWSYDEMAIMKLDPAVA